MHFLDLFDCPAPFLGFCLRQAMIGSDSCHEIVVFEVQGMYLTVEVNKYDLVLNDSKGTLGSANTLGGECMNLFKYN